ncbi:MAG: hypothetical protein Q8R83_10715 [Legionellaceae bacterium]|nr:hypothetical protein [Legionellaceae bacterium]
MFSRWDHLNHWDSLAHVTLLGTTVLSIPDISASVAEWIANCQ